MQRGVVIVSAPAGAGKSHLVAQWCAGHQRGPMEVAWVALDHADRDPARFLRYVTAAIGATPAGREAMASIMPLPPLTQPDEDYRLALAEAMTRLRGHVVLVLDSFEQLLGSESERLLRSVFGYPPDRVRVIVLTRVDPGLGQARLRMAQRLLEIGPSDLAFTVEETRELLESHGVIVAEPELARLQERTQGWIAAVRIAAASLTTSPTRSPAASMLEWEGELHEFLTTEAYERQSEGTRNFMMRACIVDSVCPGLAEVLTGRRDSEDVLIALQRAHPLGGMTEEDGHWYRWQPLVAGLLRRRLHDQSRRLESELHSAAACWLLDDGRPVEAVKHALAAGDTHTAMTILGERWLDLFIDGESAVLVDLLSSFDDDTVAASPGLAVASALMRVRQDDVESALAFARLAVTLAGMGGGHRDREVVTMATMVRLYAATMTGRPCEGGAGTMSTQLLGELADSERPLTRRQRVCRALLLGNLGAFEASRQQWEPAEAHLESASAEAVILDLPYLGLSCSAHLAMRHFYAGGLTRANEEALKVIEAAANRGWRSYHGLTAAHLALAGIAVLRDELALALHHLDMVQSVLRPMDRVSSVRSALLRATTLCSMGRVNEATHEFEHLEDLADDGELPDWVSAFVTTGRARHEAYLGRPEVGLSWLQAQKWQEAGIAPSAVCPYPVVHADLLLKCGHAVQAREALEGWTERDNGWPVHIAVLVMDAVAADTLGSHDEALRLLGTALELAAAERVIQPFMSSGRHLRPLLEELLERGSPEEALLIEVLAHMRPGAAGAAPTSGLSPYYVEPLSEREIEVLRHLQGTATNEEVARRLFVSVNTLRSHMKSINRKLAATDRRDAVRRARQLAIL